MNWVTLYALLSKKIEESEGIHNAVVETLPATGVENTLYFVPRNPGKVNDIYDEYLWVDNKFEKIGTTEIDLSGYLKTDDVARVALTGSYNDLSDKPASLPATDISDDGKGLIVKNGAWDKSAIPSYEDFIYEGNPITFSKLKAGYAKSLKVKLNPIQSGSGDPSPENIRPISGRNSVSATINGETKTVTFDHTVYGGEADLTEGKLPEDMAIVDMGDLTYSAITGSRYVQVLKNNIQEVTGKDIKRTSDAFLITSIWTFLQTVNSVRFATDLTPEEFKTLVTGQTLCYELATPTESTFTPQSVALNKGENVISTDGDSLYLVHNNLELPPVASSDEGKVLTVDANGEWIASALPDGTNTQY